MTTITSVALLTIGCGHGALASSAAPLLLSRSTPPPHQPAAGGICTCFSHHKHWTSHQHWTVYSNFKMREGWNIPLFAVLDPIRPSNGWGGVDNWRDMRCEGSWISAPAGTVSTPPRCWPTNEAGVPGRARSCGPPGRRTSDTLILQHNLYFAFILVQTNGRGFLKYF